VDDHKESRGTSPKQDSVQVINFQVGGDEYAVDIQSVREVTGLREITQLPNAPPFVKGVINLRGEVIPIIDLREKLGITQVEYDDLTNIIFVELEAKVIGVVVDRVSHVIRLSSADISPAPPLIGGLSGRFVTGVAKLEHGLVVILNMAKILTAEEVIELERLEETAQGQVEQGTEV
jgi:purine-binding chemotaxis protein CheW